MTLPFENDTSVITKKLAKRNVSSNRIFCFFNVLTIVLAISLIVGISLFQQGSKIRAGVSAKYRRYHHFTNDGE